MPIGAAAARLKSLGTASSKTHIGTGLFAIGVSMDTDGWKSVKPFPAEHELNYPVVIGNHDLAERS